MSGFGNIGTGLAGFMQGYQSSQTQAAQRALQQLAIQQQQRQQLATRLLGSASLFGGLGAGVPAPPAPGQPSVPSFPQGGGAPPIPPTPQAPAGAMAGGAPPMPAPPAVPDITPELPWQATQPDGSVIASIPPKFDPGASVARELASEPDPGSAAPPAAAATAPTPSGSAGPGGGGAEQATAAGGSPASPVSASSPLIQQLLDPEHAYKAIGTLRDRIAQAAPPGTDPAVIWEATQQLYKLTGGSTMERAQAAAYLKMAGLDLRQQGIQQQGELGKARIATTQRGQDMSQAGRRETQDRIDARSTDRRAAQAQKAAIDRGDRASARKLQNLRAQLAAQSAIAQNAPSGSAQEKAATAKMGEIAKQIEDAAPSGTVAPPE